jgi:hypothetical protein
MLLPTIEPATTQRLDALLRGGVDDVNPAWRLDDADIHPPSVTADRQVIRVTAQRNLLCHFQRLGVDDVEGAHRLVADIEAGAVRSDGGAVAGLDTGNLTDDLVGGRIDEVNVVAGAVGLDDQDPARRAQRQRGQHDRSGGGAISTKRRCRSHTVHSCCRLVG